MYYFCSNINTLAFTKILNEISQNYWLFNYKTNNTFQLETSMYFLSMCMIL